MRHFFITQAAEADVPVPVTESLVGHMSPDMVNHYTHIRTQAKQQAVAKIEKQHEAVLEMLKGAAPEVIATKQ